MSRDKAGQIVDGARSLVVQSILFGNRPEDIQRAADAVANSAKWAIEEGFLGKWTLHLGDSSPERVLQDDRLAHMRESALEAGGSLDYDFFGANLGHGGGHNALAAQSHSDALLFLNPDALVAPGTLTELFRALSDGVGIVDARQVPFEHPKTFAVGSGDTSWASGSCSLTWRTAFNEVGGFDSETFFLYCDDVDYSWRIKLAGYRVVHQPAARVFHDKRLTLAGAMQASSAEVYYSAEAGLLLAHKYSRPKIVRSILTAFDRSDEEPLHRAAAEYRQRRLTGSLPNPLDGTHNVGQFIAGNYAVHRY